MSRRFFSTSDFLKKVLIWTLNGTTREIRWAKDSVESRVDQVPALAKKATKATIEGDPHETRRRDGTIDPYHASGMLLSDSNRHLTSFHVYENGVVRFSKERYNDGESNVGQSSQASSAFRTGLTWQMNATQTRALWWDGAAWQQGQWSSDHNKWIAYYKGQWYAWE
ncbi:kinase domain-containing [Fusarium albosuccineum]|uniref:Kinase domain-containing n=1 Tax=Fusarium albosuccineum TaxID=1237068 RepID=A0A8H4LCI8_9HYPO|nr:kinase domain-containing [Fusarium albosuccineum]